ncbi:MAG: ribonuclease III [Deltaproteobacteria bacterium]|nr:MAG: ribonuclease III [Deltaproteobacteria bacterium]
MEEFALLLPYPFKNRALLQKALFHSSYVNENPALGIEDNERLEFLGDAVLNLCIGHLLMDAYPALKEGDLSQMRANMVNEYQLAVVAGTIELGRYVQLGRGEIQTGGREKPSILADAMEAVIAAVYLDGGFSAAFDFVGTLFADVLATGEDPVLHHDPKSRLQELVQLHFRSVPVYRVVEESGPDHNKAFRIRLTAGSIESEGVGRSKKAAEQTAARNAIKQFKNQKVES